MTTTKRPFNARLTDDAHALIVALSEHFSTLEAPTSLTAIVERAVRELAKRAGVSAKPRHYRRE